MSTLRESFSLAFQEPHLILSEEHTMFSSVGLFLFAEGHLMKPSEVFIQPTDEGLNLTMSPAV